MWWYVLARGDGSAGDRPPITVTTVEATRPFNRIGSDPFPSGFVLWPPVSPAIAVPVPPCEASKLADKWRGFVPSTAPVQSMSRRAGVWLQPAGRSLSCNW